MATLSKRQRRVAAARAALAADTKPKLTAGAIDAGRREPRAGQRMGEPIGRTRFTEVM
jgi:hypothetical protein